MKLLTLIFFASLCFGQTTQWFYVSNGPTHCSGQTVAGPLPKITFTCANADEAQSGSYTAKTNLAVSTFMFGMSNAKGTGLTCMVAVNSTNGPLSEGSFGIVQPLGAVYRCASSQQGESLSVWSGNPAIKAIVIPKKKEKQ